MKIKPLFDRVVIKPEQGEAPTISGIMLPEVAQEKSQIGVILAVGDGGSLNGNEYKTQVKKGDRVLFSKFAGTEVKVGKDELMVLRQTDILAILEEEK